MEEIGADEVEFRDDGLHEVEPSPGEPRALLHVATLPYPADALEPYLGAEAVVTHFEGHHRANLLRLEAALAADGRAPAGLEDLVRSATGSLFRCAAQVWNHAMCWSSMAPTGGGAPRSLFMRRLVEESFGSYAGFRDRFQDLAAGLVGSGYLWLHRLPGESRISLTAAPNVANPLSQGGIPILGFDLWEHAYYLDYKNDLDQYVEAFLDELLDWSFAERRYVSGGLFQPPAGAAAAASSGAGDRTPGR